MWGSNFPRLLKDRKKKKRVAPKTLEISICSFWVQTICSSSKPIRDWWSCCKTGVFFVQFSSLHTSINTCYTHWQHAQKTDLWSFIWNLTSQARAETLDFPNMPTTWWDGTVQWFSNESTGLNCLQWNLVGVTLGMLCHSLGLHLLMVKWDGNSTRPYRADLWIKIEPHVKCLT